MLDAMIRSHVLAANYDAIFKAMGMLTVGEGVPSYEDIPDIYIYSHLMSDHEGAWAYCTSLRDHYIKRLGSHFNHLTHSEFLLGVSFGVLMSFNDDLLEVLRLVPNAALSSYCLFVDTYYPGYHVQDTALQSRTARYCPVQSASRFFDFLE